MNRTAGPSSLALAAAASAGAAALWLILAWRTPTSTYHFAPLIAAGVGPYVTRARSGRRAFGEAIQPVLTSAAVVAASIAALATGDRFQGPTFWSEDGALGEAILFLVLGAAAGLVMLIERNRSHSPAAE